MNKEIIHISCETGSSYSKELEEKRIVKEVPTFKEFKKMIKNIKKKEEK